MKDSSRKQIEEKDQSKFVPTNSDSNPGFGKDQKKDDVDDFYDDLEKPSKIVSEVPNKLDHQGRVGVGFMMIKVRRIILYMGSRKGLTIIPSSICPLLFSLYLQHGFFSEYVHTLVKRVKVPSSSNPFCFPLFLFFI